MLSTALLAHCGGRLLVLLTVGLVLQAGLMRVDQNHGSDLHNEHNSYGHPVRCFPRSPLRRESTGWKYELPPEDPKILLHPVIYRCPHEEAEDLVGRVKERGKLRTRIEREMLSCETSLCLVR